MDIIDQQLRERAIAYLTQDELYSIEKMLGREPNPFELNMFAAMWSEHISYKSSIKWIEELPVSGKRVFVKAGEENAGVIDLGDNLACVVKMESHNHPIAVDPAQGAVCVGNINRDLVSMGATPMAHMNILRFGDLKNDFVKQMFDSVVKALGSYSNNFGVPVVGGEVLFDRSFNLNPLLNILGISIIEKDKMVKAEASSNKEYLVLVGKKTSGRGVHGAGFASKGLRNAGQIVPESQVADPFLGRVLMDCIKEMGSEKLIRGMQDIGAGGVLCAATEMAYRGSSGVELHLDKIPVQREDLTPISRMLSQTQEQMLITVRKNDLERIGKIAGKWELDFGVVGKVIKDERVRIFDQEQLMGDLPVSILVRGGGAPVYIRNIKSSGKQPVKVSADDVPFARSLKEVAKEMIKLPNIASRKWIYEQFDTMAGLTNLSAEYASDAAILHIKGQNRALAVSVDGNTRYGRIEAKKGTMISVAEAARNIICSGGMPLAVADCLNFGDPADPFVYHDFAESIKGISAVCNEMDIPVIAGNVSFHNLTYDDGEVVSIIPTPVIGMVGIIEDLNNIMTLNFKSKGDMIFLIGRSDNDLSGSEYLSSIHLIEECAAPEFDLEYELKMHSVVASLISKKLVRSAHDVSIGGLFVTLVECALPNNLGFDVTSPAEIRSDAFLFGESQSRVVVSVSPENETDFLDYMMETDIHFSALGHITKQELRVDDVSFGFISDYARDFESALAKHLDAN